ncbi:MAG: Subtilisin-like serine protease, partial [bacterium]
TGTDGTSGIELWVIADDVSGVEEVDGVSRPVTLLQNFPNPAGVSTRIAYSLATGQDVRLDLCDVNGRLVQTLVNQWQSAGTHRFDMSASGLADGAYFYRLTTASGVERKKMLLIR